MTDTNDLPGMCDSDETRKIGEYWEKRFAAEGMIWSEEPSLTVRDAAEWFTRFGARVLLVPGAGYGRNTRYLSESFEVDGIEISQAAIRLARSFDPRTRFRLGSAFDPELSVRLYDGIYCYDLLHLFLEEDRRRLLKRLSEWLSPGGLLYLTVFSDEDENCGEGVRLEPGTYEYKPGKYAHFYSEEELCGLLPEYERLEMQSWQEPFPPEGDLPRYYRLRSLVARKNG